MAAWQMCPRLPRGNVDAVRPGIAYVPNGGSQVDWIAVALTGGSLVVSVAVLILVWLNLQSTRRAEQAGEERLEMLREQQERLQFMREERRMLEDELEWRRSMMNGEGRPLELEATTEFNGHSESEPPQGPFRLRRIFGN